MIFVYYRKNCNNEKKNLGVIEKFNNFVSELGLRVNYEKIFFPNHCILICL